nr:hypothetical protein [uncultured Rhodopila sp.]
MSGTTPPPGEMHSWDEVYKWELEEVYLLLDFIAGRPDKRLASLEVEVPEENPAEPGKTTIRKVGAPEIAARISALRFPPEGTDLKRSQEAAFLLLVKDRLCALAYPATAQSIAFTDIVASKTVTLAQTIWQPLHRLRKPRIQPERSPVRPRVSVGLRAFPDLEDIAISFCAFQRRATWTAILLAGVGTLLLAEVTYGGQLTARLQGAKRDAGGAAAAIYSAYAEKHPSTGQGGTATLARVQNICPVPPPGSGIGTEGSQEKPKAQPPSTVLPTSAATDPTQQADLAGNVDPKLIQLCDAYAYDEATFENAIADVDAYARSWLGRGVSEIVPIHRLDPECKPSGGSDHCGPKQETGPSVSGMVSAFANYILPLIFGLVGALAGTTRVIQDKILDSVLVPRDKSLLWLRVLLGGIAGAAAGLFFDPAKVAAEITSGNSGLSVSASGIAFLAGYGAPAFFGLLDTVLARVFNLSGGRAPGGATPEVKAS